MNPPCVGLIGDYDASVRAHLAIPEALRLACAATETSIHHTWLPTVSLDGDLRPKLSAFDGLWCVPGSPYQNMTGALSAIRFAREQSIPFLGTCGGFQHAVIEYARHVLGWAQADHAESNPAAAMPLVSLLSCSLIGVSGKIRLQPGSRAAAIYGAGETIEEYHCNFGVNRRFQSQLETGGLRITGTDEAEGVRVVELAGHPFFLATLFQPELSAFKGVAHPLVSAFVRVAVGNAP